MITAKISENEDERLRDLLKYEMLDTPEDQEYNDVVKLASYICDAPIALISLLDSCRQWFKAEFGLGEKETHRDLSFCAHAIHYDHVMMVEDALEDERFFDNPLVTSGPKVRFYAGAPLTSPAGYKLGTLCVLDNKPRSLTDEQVFALETLSRHVVQKFELRQKSDHLRKVFKQYVGLQTEFDSRLKAYAKAQNTAGIAIFELDLKTGRYKSPESFINLMGWPAGKEISREDVVDCVHPNNRAEYLQFFQNTLNGETYFEYEYRCQRFDNQKEIYLNSTGKVIRNEKGEAIKVLGIKQDITDKKRYEEELKAQNAELKKVNQELDHFVSRVSHDLRAPISTVLGLIDLILNHEQDIEKVKELLFLVKKSLQKQDDFIKDILNYSRNSRMALEVEEINFRKILEEIFSHLVYSYNSENIPYSIEVDQSTAFKTDRSRLYVVLTNVISNALKYQNSRNEQTSVEVIVKADVHKATIRVADTGVGIEAKHLDKVFEMFYRATDKKPGSGLGLYIVKESVAKLNGMVEISSEYGKGTSVTIELPNMGELPGEEKK